MENILWQFSVISFLFKPTYLNLHVDDDNRMMVLH